MTISSRHRLRALAVATLVALCGALLGGLLTTAFPDFGMPQPFSGILYIPPQAFLVVILAPTALALACVASFSGLRQSRQARRPGWAGAFTVLLLLLLLGPAFLLCSFGAAWSPVFLPLVPTFHWQADVWWTLTAGSAVVLALVAVCTLVYASQAISPERPR